MKFIRIFVCLSVTLLCSSCRLFVDDYAIKMNKSSKIGDKSELIASGSLVENLSESTYGNAPEKSKLIIKSRLEGVSTVLAVDKLHRETKFRLIVTKFESYIKRKKIKKFIVPKGTEIIGQVKNGRDEFFIAGKPANEDIAKILSHLTTLPDGPTTDDDVFGTKERKSVDEKWSVDRLMAAKSLSSKDLKITSDQITGNSMIDKVVMKDGVECLLIKARVKVSNMDSSKPDANDSVMKFKLMGEFSGEYPVDSSKRCYSRLSVNSKIITEMNMGKTSKTDPDDVQISFQGKYIMNIQSKLLKQ